MTSGYIRNLRPKIRKQLPIALNIIKKKNIIKLTNIRQLLDELKSNISSENAWATFYLIEVFSERIADFIIIKEQDVLKTMSLTDRKGKLFTIEDKISTNYFSFGIKIRFLEKLINSERYPAKDFKTFVDILELLNFIRNRYMFHFMNYDEYSFIYDKKEMYKKEEHFIKNLSKLVGKMKVLLNDFDKDSFEWHLIKDDSSFLEGSIESYKRSIEACKKSGGRRRMDSTGVYDVLIRLLSEISLVFILFLGKENLKLIS